jgi:hypothetical protein
MPKGPQGQKRPADVIGNAVHVMRLSTGEIQEAGPPATKNQAAVELGHLGGKARADNLSKKQLVRIAKDAARSRWRKAG